MKQWQIALSVLTCALGVVFLVKHHADAPPEKTVQIGQESSTTKAKPTVGDSQKASEAQDISTQQDYFIPVTGGPPKPIIGIDPFPNIPKSRVGLPMGSDPFVAQSREEQQWLDRNGFPNEQQWLAYSAASDVILEAAAAHGDQIAGVMLAARQFAHGDPEASGKLLTAGMNGSGFALNTLASYLDSSKKFGNPELGYAISRVAEMRGDWRAGFVREVMFTHTLSPEQKANANGKALEILGEFRKSNPMGSHFDPRPLPPIKN